ncbi:hypothetical protein SynPROSU1_01526 [Synechococcus sp. PROS-U-1]|nr:hypothetical protein SynPROSU1_01526 [Synechococcus sp. PROS-U-1]
MISLETDMECQEVSFLINAVTGTRGDEPMYEKSSASVVTFSSSLAEALLNQGVDSSCQCFHSLP